MGCAADQYRIPFLVGVVGHRDLRPEETAAIRVAVAQLLQRLRDDHPAVPLRLICSMAAVARVRKMPRPHRYASRTPSSPTILPPVGRSGPGTKRIS